MEGPKASSDDWAVTSRTTVDNVDPSHIQGEDTCGMLDGSFLELLRAAGKLRGDSQSPRLSSAVSEAKHLRASPLYTCMLQRWTPHVCLNTFGLPSFHHLNCKYEAYFYCRYEVLRTSGHLKGVCFCVFYHLIRMPSLHFAVETASTVFFFPEHFLCVRAPNTCSWKSFRKGADFFSQGHVTCHPGSQKAAEDTRSGCVCVSWSSSDSNRKDHM